MLFGFFALNMLIILCLPCLSDWFASHHTLKCLWHCLQEWFVQVNQRVLRAGVGWVWLARLEVEQHAIRKCRGPAVFSLFTRNTGLFEHAAGSSIYVVQVLRKPTLPARPRNILFGRGPILTWIRHQHTIRPQLLPLQCTACEALPAGRVQLVCSHWAVSYYLDCDYTSSAVSEPLWLPKMASQVRAHIMHTTIGDFSTVAK